MRKDNRNKVLKTCNEVIKLLEIKQLVGKQELEDKQKEAENISKPLIVK